MNWKIRLKVLCTARGETVGWGEHKILHSFKFAPVASGSDENKEFFAATPSGSIEFATVISQAFEVGHEYYVDLAPVDAS